MILILVGGVLAAIALLRFWSRSPRDATWWERQDDTITVRVLGPDREQLERLGLHRAATLLGPDIRVGEPQPFDVRAVRPTPLSGHPYWADITFGYTVLR